MKQLTFPYPMNCIHVYPNGHEEKVRYGYYEGVEIIAENGWTFNDRRRDMTLTPPQYLCTEVTRKDGVRIIFEKPFFLIKEKGYGDDSGREAPRYF